MTEVAGVDLNMIAQSSNKVDVHKNLSSLEHNQSHASKANHVSSMESGKRKKMAMAGCEGDLQSASQASKRPRCAADQKKTVGPVVVPLDRLNAELVRDIKNNSKKSSTSLTPFRAASKTKMTQHMRKLKKAGLLNNAEAVPPPGVITSHAPASSSTSRSTSSFLTNTVMKLFRSGSSTTPNYQNPEDMDVVREIDHDVATAVVSVGGSLLGLPQEELMQSQGMRKLVARNMQWFQGSPDFIKMIGLVAAKKLNQIVQRRHPPALPYCSSLDQPPRLPFQFGMEYNMQQHPMKTEPTDEENYWQPLVMPESTPLEDTVMKHDEQPSVLDMIQNQTAEETAKAKVKRPRRLTIKPMQHAPVTLITEDVTPLVPFPVSTVASSSVMPQSSVEPDAVSQHGTTA